MCVCRVGCQLSDTVTDDFRHFNRPGPLSSLISHKQSGGLHKTGIDLVTDGNIRLALVYV